MYIFDNYKDSIKDFLINYLISKENSFKNISVWGEDIIKRLEDFVINGKMLRGSLVFLSFSLFKDSFSEDVLKTACALELFQSALLIHDDIMDEDSFRRANLSIFSQYKKLADDKDIAFSKHFGESMGICAGDLGFFLGYELLSEVSKTEVVKITSEEFMKVIISQMQDVFNGININIPEESDILNVYKYKTGRYTFSLPLVLGAILGNGDLKTTRDLEKLGEKLGIIFQIKDDTLGFLGDKKTIGKKVGSDIIQNKKTLYYLYLFKMVSKNEKEKLYQIFGNKDLNLDEINYVINLAKKFGVIDIVNNKINNFAKEIEIDINNLSFSQNYKNKLLDLLNFSLFRNK